VLFLNHVSEVGGAEVSLLDTIACLDPGRFECRAVIPPGGRLAELLAERRVDTDFMPLRRFRRTRSPAVWADYTCSFLSVVPRLVRLIKRTQIDVLHANSATAQIYGGPAARLAGVPSIWHHRDLIDLGRIGHWLYRLCSRVIAISDAVAQDLTAQGVEGEKLVTITNGVDFRRRGPRGQRDSARTGMGLGPHHVVFTMIGQLTPWKRHHIFLEAAALISRQLADARFLVVGADLFEEHEDYRDHLENLARRLGLTSKVVFTGHCRDIVPVIEGSDVLVHPADREPFGRVIVEAMALGKPVVAIDACGPRQIIRHGVDGLLVPPEDTNALAEAALRLASDPGFASRLSRSGRERAVREFGLDNFRKRLEAMYDSVIREEEDEDRG